MSLTVGSRFGSFEVLGSLGAGGMGEVYRARDTKLQRDVALKVLLPAVANDPERLARFRRESQVLASLGHPNIGAIHALEEAGDVIALVLELVEGPTLADRIARGPIPIDETLPIARQIAEALEAAHEQGIIHRDLKPANIKVRDDGTVKILDFGVAKALDQAPSLKSRADGQLANSPTITSPAHLRQGYGGQAMTQAGIILGTAAYMSPEQAAGKPVDRRTDLWALGVVLLEMLTGRPVFTGETVTHVLAAVLTATPDWSSLPANAPEPLRRLLRRCLERDRRRRIDSAADAQLELQDALAAPAADGPSAAGHAVAPSSLRARLVPWALAATFGVALAAVMVRGWMTGGRDAPADRPLVRLEVALGPDVSLPVPTGDGPAIVISPDGTRLAYVSGSPPTLFTRSLDQAEPSRLSGTEGTERAFFSDDGQWLAFMAGNTLRKVSVAGGAPIHLATLGGFGGRALGTRRHHRGEPRRGAPASVGRRRRAGDPRDDGGR